MESMADVFGVEGAGFVEVAGALDDGAAVGEDSDLAVGDFQAEEEFVGGDAVGGAGLSEPLGEIVEIEGLLLAAGSQLDGVSATKTDGAEAAAAGEEFVISLGTAGAAGAEVVERHLVEVVFPGFDADEAAVDGVEVAGEDFEGFEGLEVGDDADERSDDAGGFAGFELARLGGIFEEAAEAGLAAGEDDHDQSTGGQGGAVDPGDVVFEGNVVDEVAGVEIVGAVEDELGGVGEFFDGVGIDVGDDGFDGDVGVDTVEFAGGGLGLGEVFVDVALVEEDLALEVVEFDEIAVDDSE